MQAGFSCAKGNSSFPALVDAFVGWCVRDSPFPSEIAAADSILPSHVGRTV